MELSVVVAAAGWLKAQIDTIRGWFGFGRPTIHVGGDLTVYVNAPVKRRKKRRRMSHDAPK